MNITYAAFFQPVELPKANGQRDLVKWVSSKNHTATLVGQFIKVQPKDGGEAVYVTIFNTSFFRTDNEDINASPKTSGKNTTKAKAEQD